MTTRRTLAALLALSTTLPAAARAQETDDAPGPTGPSFSGFVDSSLLTPVAGQPSGTRGVTFGLNQVELDARVSPDANLEVGVDLNFFPASPIATDDALLEQGFVTWSPESTEGLSLTIGKQNAPIGLESLDSIDIPAASGGLIWQFAVPSNLTGLFVEQELPVGTGLLFATADWDSPGANGEVLVGARYDIEAGPLAVGLVGTHGPIPEVEADPTAERDTDIAGSARSTADLTLTLSLDSATVWGEFVYNTLGDDDATGWTVAGNYELSDSASVTGRLDQLKKSYGTAVDETDLTVAALLQTTPHLRTAIEVKHQLPEAGDAQTSAALQFIASF